MKKLWKFEWEREFAFIGGLFTATDEEVKNLSEKKFTLENTKENTMKFMERLKQMKSL